MLLFFVLSGEEWLYHTIKPEDGGKNHQWRKAQTERRLNAEDSRQGAGKHMQSSLLLSYRKASLGSEQLDVPYGVLQQEKAAPESLYRSRGQWRAGRRRADQQAVRAASLPGRACFKGECQELSHHREGGSLIPECQPSSSLVERAQLLLTARLDESQECRELGAPQPLKRFASPHTLFKLNELPELPQQPPRMSVAGRGLGPHTGAYARL